MGLFLQLYRAFLLCFEPQDCTDLREKTVEDARCKTCSRDRSLFYLPRLKTLSGRISSFLVFSKAPFHDMRVRKRTNDISNAYRNVKEDNSNLRLMDASEFHSDGGVVGALDFINF